jgi:hypothetical protein
MRIISKWHDYYDNAMALGYDDSVIYDRTTIEFDLQKKPVPERISSIVKMLDKKSNDLDWYIRWYSMPHSLRGKNFNLIISTYRFIFCGKRYDAISFRKDIDGDPIKYKSETFYDIESVVDYLVKNGININQKLRKYSKDPVIKQFSSFFDDVKQPDRNWLIENKVTVACIDDQRLIINPCLKDYDFYRMFDAYTAFQELDMWVSGTLSYPQNFMVDIGDKYKILEHGFDPKYGFRTRPK